MSLVSLAATPAPPEPQSAKSDVEERREAELASRRLAAIVESSDDAIIAKDLNGVITSWNRGAERLFGYTAEEAIGQPVTMLIPIERHDEEPEIIGRIRRGDRIDHYETVRRRKDGSLVEISLAVSPIRDASGVIVGASKIARDITERKRVQEQERLLMREMNHRVKNLFSLAGSIVSISARHAESPKEMAQAVRERLSALSRAHDLTLSDRGRDGAIAEKPTTLAALLRTLADPYLEEESGERIKQAGPTVVVGGRAVTGLALLLHELMTNAAKYGALSTPAGRLSITWLAKDGNLVLNWHESGGPPIVGEPEENGFGSVLSNATISQFGGTMSRDWRPEGLAIQLSLPLERLET
jgi:PAS domain S-box-containing protein